MFGFLWVRRHRSQPTDRSLEAQALECIKNGPILVEALYLELKKRSATLDAADVTELVWRLVREGRIALEDMPPPTDSVVRYLQIWDENIWFYVALTTSILALACVYLIPTSSMLIPLRWVLGAALALFIPGYVILKALFPSGRDLDTFIRFALSVGLSLVATMMMGLFLNYTSWGIRSAPILMSMTGLTIGLTIVAFIRQLVIAANKVHSMSPDRR
jgi:hypothetical protein